MHKAWLWISLMMLAGSSSSAAEEFKRFEFQPFGGFGVSGGIPLTAQDNTSYGSVSVNSSYMLGATFGINLNNLDAVEALWRRQYTEGRLQPEVAVPVLPGGVSSFNLKIDQIHCNFLHHYLLSIPGVKPYIMGGLGATTYRAQRGGQGASISRFSFALGTGIKYFFNDHFGLRGEARYAPTVVTVSDSHFWCTVGGAGADCVIHLKMTLQSQLDLTGGIVIRF
jgi:opacity protein-like surface antigen